MERDIYISFIITIKKEIWCRNLDEILLKNVENFGNEFQRDFQKNYSIYNLFIFYIYLNLFIYTYILYIHILLKSGSLN